MNRHSAVFSPGWYARPSPGRYIAICDGALNHLAHHRGQLTGYLRLHDVPVPSLYGPTADERGF
jgi:hypothetical protein